MNSNSDFDENYIKKLLPERAEDSHKGTFGHVLNIAGSGFYSGAAYFSSMASLKVGCGRSTLASGNTVITAVSALSPDIILLPLEETTSKTSKTISLKAAKTLEPLLKNYQAISVGSGLSTDKEVAKFFKRLLESLRLSETPVVIDADGLNMLSTLKINEVEKLPLNTILTPHPMEMSRLMKVSVDNILLQPEFWAKKCCEKYDCITILKTHKTVVSDNRGHVYINNTGNSALAKGGSGDVLTGMITGFLASGVKPFDAAILAVYLHGKTGELASKELNEYSVLASDLLDYIHLAIKELI